MGKGSKRFSSCAGKRELERRGREGGSRSTFLQDYEILVKCHV